MGSHGLEIYPNNIAQSKLFSLSASYALLILRDNLISSDMG